MCVNRSTGALQPVARSPHAERLSRERRGTVANSGDAASCRVFSSWWSQASSPPAVRSTASSGESSGFPVEEVAPVARGGARRREDATVQCDHRGARCRAASGSAVPPGRTARLPLPRDDEHAAQADRRTRVRGRARGRERRQRGTGRRGRERRHRDRHGDRNLECRTLPPASQDAEH